MLRRTAVISSFGESVNKCQALTWNLQEKGTGVGFEVPPRVTWNKYTGRSEDPKEKQDRFVCGMDFERNVQS